jgi:hypothetical protein
MKKISKNRNRITVVLLMIMIVLGLFFYRNFFNPEFNSNSAKKSDVLMKVNDLISFSFVPGEIKTLVGDKFTVNVMIDPGKHLVSNGDLIFSYDKAKLKLESISQSDAFAQVLSIDISKEGSASYSASTEFGKNVSSKAEYATLHFYALEKTEKSKIIVNREKSGIYADDKPGFNNLGDSIPVEVIIDD